MGRVGSILPLMLLAAHARGEPMQTSDDDAAAYAPLASAEAHKLRSHAEFELPALPAHPLRQSLTSSEVSRVGAREVSPRLIRVVLDTSSVASFPTDDEPNASVRVSAVPATYSRSIRKNLDDDGFVFGATRRLIRRSFDDYGEFAPVSAARHLRGTLD